MKTQFFCLAVATFASFTANADGVRPPNFGSDSNKAIFVDFKKAHHRIEYDVEKKVTRFVSTIQFTAHAGEQGFPIFDLVEEHTFIELDGKKVTQALIETPDKKTKLRVVGKVVSNSKPHILRIGGEIKNNLIYQDDSVRNGFWMTDLLDRNYLERYLPSNLDYDQFAVTLNVRVIGTKRKHVLMTNGVDSSRIPNQFQIQFPETFTTSCFFYHLAPEDAIQTLQTKFKSTTGRTVEILLYKKSETKEDLNKYAAAAIEAVTELERTFTPYIHPRLVVYAAGEGGMEHSGATITSLEALSHEVSHMWFGRGMLSTMGSGGWIDEAIASWRDAKYPTFQTPAIFHSIFVTRGDYCRVTSERSYRDGMWFIGGLNLHVGKDGLFDFLRSYIPKKTWAPITTTDFFDDMTAFTGKDIWAYAKSWNIFATTGGGAEDCLIKPDQTVNRPTNRPREPRGRAVRGSKHDLLTPELARRLL